MSFADRRICNIRVFNTWVRFDPDPRLHQSRRRNYKPDAMLMAVWIVAPITLFTMSGPLSVHCLPQARVSGALVCSLPSQDRLAFIHYAASVIGCLL